jgi:hypothetical protein
MGLERGRQEFALRVDRLVQPHDVIVDVAEVDARVLGDVREIESHQAIADFDERRDRAAQ